MTEGYAKPQAVLPAWKVPNTMAHKRSLPMYFSSGLLLIGIFCFLDYKVNLKFKISSIK